MSASPPLVAHTAPRRTSASPPLQPTPEGCVVARTVSPVLALTSPLLRAHCPPRRRTRWATLVSTPSQGPSTPALCLLPTPPGDDDFFLPTSALDESSSPSTRPS